MCEYHTDYDTPAFMHTKVRRCRKLRACCECNIPIRPGDKYEFTSGKWDGYMDTHYACLVCADVRDRFVNEHGGTLLGGLMEDLEGCVDGLPYDPESAEWVLDLIAMRARLAASSAVQDA